MEGVASAVDQVAAVFRSVDKVLQDQALRLVEHWQGDFIPARTAPLASFLHPPLMYVSPT
jgi:hypothetical protein